MKTIADKYGCWTTFGLECIVEAMALINDLGGRGREVVSPNGGPGAFGDVARGKIDVYVAFKQPFVDVFPGLAIAEQAGAAVTTFDGEPVIFKDDIEQRYDLICSATPALHEQILAEIQRIRKGASHAAA